MIDSLTFNFAMGFIGLVLSGISLERGRQYENKTIIIRGISELIIGLYFFVAAIGST